MPWIPLNYDCNHCGGDLKAFDLFGDGLIYDTAEVFCSDCGRKGAIEADDDSDSYRVVGISDEDRFLTIKNPANRRG